MKRFINWNANIMIFTHLCMKSAHKLLRVSISEWCIWLRIKIRIDFTEMKISIHLTEIQYLIGAYEPTDAECDWPSDDDDELAEEIKDKVR